MVKNTSGETSRKHVAMDPKKDEMVQRFVRRTTKSKKIPLRLRE